jgi:hypothetical protein
MVTDTPTAMVGTTRLTPIHLTGAATAGGRGHTLGARAPGAIATAGPRRGHGHIRSGARNLGVIATAGRRDTIGTTITA